MKFRCKLNKEGLLSLIDISEYIGKMGTNAIILLSETEVKISAFTEGAIDLPRCFVEISVDRLFHDYKIESQSSNEILFEIDILSLTRALSSGKNARESQLKLVKRNDKPCISFDVASASSVAIAVVHDIPIRLFKTSDMINYLPPEIPMPQVGLELPRGRSLLRGIIDRMGKFSKQVGIQAHQQFGGAGGRIIFRVEHPSAIIKSAFHALRVATLDGEEIDPDNKASVIVDLKRLSLVLSYTNHFNQTKATLYLSDNACLFIHISLEVGDLSIYLPVILRDMDDDR